MMLSVDISLSRLRYMWILWGWFRCLEFLFCCCHLSPSYGRYRVTASSQPFSLNQSLL